MSDKKYYEEDSFLDLQKEWYSKLEQSGFNDIEIDEHNLERISKKDLISKRDNKTYEYFKMASEFLHEEDFKKRIDYVTWELHSSGMPIRDIQYSLKRMGFKRLTSFCRVRNCIEKYKAKMRGF